MSAKQTGTWQSLSGKACTPMALEQLHAIVAYELRIFRLKTLCCIIMGVMGLQESLCGLIVAASANPIGRTLTAGPTSGTSTRSQNRMSLMCGHALVILSAWPAVSHPLPLPVHHAIVLLWQMTPAALEHPQPAQNTQELLHAAVHSNKNPMADPTEMSMPAQSSQRLVLNCLALPFMTVCTFLTECRMGLIPQRQPPTMTDFL